MICIHKRPAKDLPHNRVFDTALSRLRVRSEHCMGALKGRWSCLNGLRINIRSNKDHIRACRWITIAIILHNSIIDLEGIGSAEYFLPQGVSQQSGDVALDLEPEWTGDNDEAGEAKRALLVQEINAFRNSQH